MTMLDYKTIFKVNNPQQMSYRHSYY